MRRTVTALGVLAAATAMTATATATATSATSAARGSLTVSYAAARVVGQPDPTDVDVTVTVAGTDCAVKCELWSHFDRRMSEDFEKVATWRGPAGASKVIQDRLEVDAFMDHSYYVERYRADGTSEQLYYSWATPYSIADSSATIGAGFRRELDLQATETMVLRSTTPGAKVTFPAYREADRLVGIVAERGPNAGVLRADVGGRTALTVDLKSSTVTKRTVVGTVRVPRRAVLQLHNATPAGRAAKQVAVDGLIGMVTDSAARRPAPTPRDRAERSGDEGISYVVPEGQVPSGDAGINLDLSVTVHGCPDGCQVTRTVGEDNDPEVVWSKTSPNSASLQTFRIPTVAPFSRGDLVSYTLEKGGEYVDEAEVTPEKLEQDQGRTSGYDKFVYSHGWTEDEMASATGGAIMNSGTSNTGMTYRVDGEFEGRRVALVAARGPQNGVMKIYNDLKLVKTIDLYAAKWQPRQVVASFHVGIDKRITVVNATPKSRPNKDIHVDALVVFGGYWDWYRTGR